MTTEPLLVKDECQWQEESQADPLLMRQPLDIVGKSEVLGGTQEACADDSVCLCRPGPDTPENASCSSVDTRSALAVLTTGGGAGGGSGCPQEADRWSRHGSRAATLAGSFVAPPLCLFFLPVFHIFGTLI